MTDPLLAARRRRHVLRPGAGSFRPDPGGAAPGQIVCLLGGNASGKSTTMKVILGLAAAPRRARPVRRRRTSPACRRRSSSAAVSAACPRRGACSRHDGAREPADGRLRAQRPRRGRARIWSAMSTLFPRVRRARSPARRHAVGRRAADGRDGARADGPAAADLHGRADHGPVAAVTSIACWS